MSSDKPKSSPFGLPGKVFGVVLGGLMGAVAKPVQSRVNELLPSKVYPIEGKKGYRFSKFDWDDDRNIPKITWMHNPTSLPQTVKLGHTIKGERFIEVIIVEK